MDYDFISERLAKELVSGSQMLQCLEVAVLLQKLLRQRDKTITILSDAAVSLNGHYQRAAIAKSVGSVAGTGGKVATGIGAAAMAWAPLSGGLSLIATAGCAIVGGATWAAGTAVTLGTYVVEKKLCDKLITEAKDAITCDQTYAGQLKEAWDGLKRMLESFYDQFQHVMSIEKIITAVWDVYQRIKKFVTSEYVDWKGVVSNVTKTPRAQVQNPKRIAVRVIKPYIVKAFEAMSINFIGLEIPGGVTIMMLGIGAVLVGFDIAVLLKNAVKLATNEEHPGAVKIKSTVEILKDERDQLQSFCRALQRHLQ